MRFIISRRLWGARRAFLPSRTPVHDDPLRCCCVLTVPATTSFRQLLRARGIRRRSLFRSLSPLRSRPTHTRLEYFLLSLTSFLTLSFSLSQPLSPPLSLSLSHSLLSYTLPFSPSHALLLSLSTNFLHWFLLSAYACLFLLAPKMSSHVRKRLLSIGAVSRTTLVAHTVALATHSPNERLQPSRILVPIRGRV